MDSDHVASDTLHQLRRRLLAFYDAHARDLPWRRTDDPYAIWVSEIMLQQTRVETVEPYYERFMERFPDVEALAAADRDEVLKEWEGLGYYRRAHLLHRAAGVVRERHGGYLPDSAAELEELPGIGPYTAGAVASIAFGETVPAVDGNVRRVLSRLFDLAEPSPAELWNRAADLVPPERPGDFNQALMELGARVCTPAAPACAACPLEELCLARARGTVEDRPAARTKKAVPEVAYAVAVAVAPGRRLLVCRRPDEGLLAGLWEFPVEEMQDGERPERAVLRALRAHGLEAAPDEPRPLDPVPHAFSHLRATYHPFLILLDEGPGPLRKDDALSLWSTFDNLAGLALPVAQQRIRDLARTALHSGAARL